MFYSKNFFGWFIYFIILYKHESFLIQYIRLYNNVNIIVNQMVNVFTFFPQNKRTKLSLALFWPINVCINITQTLFWSSRKYKMLRVSLKTTWPALINAWPFQMDNLNVMNTARLKTKKSRMKEESSQIKY